MKTEFYSSSFAAVERCKIGVQFELALASVAL
jgi:hypothetical protein